jgi:hypothetical protein
MTGYGIALKKRIHFKIIIISISFKLLLCEEGNILQDILYQAKTNKIV